MTLNFRDPSNGSINSGWRIESNPINGISNLRLFANNEVIFEGNYGKLVRSLKVNDIVRRNSEKRKP